jgi:hypothetical protein
MSNQSESKSNAIIADAVAQDDDRPFTWSGVGNVSAWCSPSQDLEVPFQSEHVFPCDPPGGALR